MVFTSAMNAIQRAIEIVGSQAELARACNQKPQALTRWVRTGKVPAHHCLAIETATNAAVTCYDLRPDVFSPPAGKQAAA